MAVEDIVQDIAEGFDDVRAELYPEGIKARLLKVNGGTVAFDLLAVLEDSWFFLDDREFRNEGELMIASADYDFGQQVLKATHFEIERDYRRDLFLIRDGDTTPPQGTEPYWRLFGSKQEAEAEYK